MRCSTSPQKPAQANSADTNPGQPARASRHQPMRVSTPPRQVALGVPRPGPLNPRCFVVSWRPTSGCQDVLDLSQYGRPPRRRRIHRRRASLAPGVPGRGGGAAMPGRAVQVRWQAIRARHLPGISICPADDAAVRVRVQLVSPWQHELNTHFSGAHQPTDISGMSGRPGGLAGREGSIWLGSRARARSGAGYIAIKRAGRRGTDRAARRGRSGPGGALVAGLGHGHRPAPVPARPAAPP
jgi:hypothetical protein